MTEYGEYRDDVWERKYIRMTYRPEDGKAR